MWLGLIKVNFKEVYHWEDIREKVDDAFKNAYFHEFLGLPIESLKFYAVEIVLKSYVPMKQSEYFLV